MPKTIVAIQNVPYNFIVERKYGIDPQFDFIDFELRDILCHVKYRIETKTLAANSRLEGMWQKEQVIQLDESADVRVEVRFGHYKVWVVCNGQIIELDLPFRTVSSRIGLIDISGFSEPANLLASDFMQTPALKSTMSSIEYSIIDARLSVLEDLINELINPGRPIESASAHPNPFQEKPDRIKINKKNERQSSTAI